MRKADRIDVMLDRLEAVWKRHPDLRLAQLIINPLKFQRLKPNIEDDPYYFEDEKFIDIIEKYYTALDFYESYALTEMNE